MITQRELETVHRAKRDLAQLEQDPAVSRYLAGKKLLDDSLAALRKRVGAGEEPRTGRYALTVKRSLSVSWEKALNLITGCDDVARALLRCEPAKELLRQAHEKDPGASFVSERISLDVVAAE